MSETEDVEYAYEQQMTALREVAKSLPAYRRVKRVLTELSEKTADEIAEALRTQGVRGTRHMSDRCPIALSLGQHFRTDEHLRGAKFSVGGMRVHVSLDGTGDKVDFELEHPVSVYEFICKFDGGEYPDLDIYAGSGERS